MSRNVAKGAGRPRQKSRRTLIWVVLSALVIVVLLYLEQTALLYVLATLSVAALLTVVAFADLRGARQSPAPAPAPPDDSAAIGDATRQRR